MTLLCFSVIVLLPALAEAGDAGRLQSVDASYIFHDRMILEPQTTYIFATVISAPSTADTVIHLQRYPSGTYLAGNDDHGGTLGSKITYTTGAGAEEVTLIVRAYDSATGGTAQLFVRGGTWNYNYPINFAGETLPLSDLTAGSHLFTVEEQGGESDTTMLVISQVSGHAIAFDDDDGLDRASWVHLQEDCAPNCSVVLGNHRPAEPPHSTTLMWDEDIHTSDCDSDGLSDALEGALGTEPCNSDTENDGIPDGAEVMGTDSSQPIKFPYMGADPIFPDVFIEADWEECVKEDNDDDTCGPPQNPNPDRWQLMNSTAAQVADFYAPHVNVHIDTGTPNNDPDTWFQAGDWGGAERRPKNAGEDKCTGISPERANLFHHGRIAGPDGGQAQNGGSCFAAGIHPAAITHESAHNFVLGHGGQDEINCKPNYHSIMSYALIYRSGIKFSEGQFLGAPLTPSALDEAFGLGTNDPSVISVLQDPLGPFRFRVNETTGGVDWNRDDRISGGTTAGAPTWAWGSGGCEVARYGESRDVLRTSPKVASGPALASLSTPDGSSRLYLLSRDGGKLKYRSTEDVYSTTRPNSISWSPSSFYPASEVDLDVPMKYSPSAVGGSDSNLLIAYTTAYGGIRLRSMYINAWGDDVWREEVSIGEGITTSPSVHDYGSGIVLYAARDSRLWGWSIVWTEGPVGFPGPGFQVIDLGPQSWSDGSPILVSEGVGLTVGYLRADKPSRRLFAAIPVQPDGTIEIAYLESDLSDGQWRRMPPETWPNGEVRTQARPGFAYVPYARDDVSNGRFYLAWNPPLGSGDRRIGLRISKTAGNDIRGAAGIRRFQWLDQAFASNSWLYAYEAVAMVYDHLVDQNPRLAFTFHQEIKDPRTNETSDLESSTLYPYADGIVDTPLRDTDDYCYMRAYMACSLTSTCDSSIPIGHCE